MNEVVVYNGWSNIETWTASLWLNNDVQLFAHLVAAKRAGRTELFQAELLEQRHVADNAPIWTNLPIAAFNRTDWSEVARNN